MVTIEMIELLKDLADVLDKHKAGLFYTNSDDGIYVSLSDLRQGQVCIGWTSLGDVSEIRKIITSLENELNRQVYDIPQWTKQLPKEDGFYWYQEGSDRPTITYFDAENKDLQFTGSATVAGEPYRRKITGEFWTEKLIDPMTRH